MDHAERTNETMDTATMDDEGYYLGVIIDMDAAEADATERTCPEAF